MTEMELLQQILTELKDVKADLASFKQETQQNFKTMQGVLGELQGDIEEIQGDTQYLSMRKIVERRRIHDDKLLKRFTPPERDRE